jgi:hypothetical protein
MTPEVGILKMADVNFMPVAYEQAQVTGLSFVLLFVVGLVVA